MKNNTEDLILEFNWLEKLLYKRLSGDQRVRKDFNSDQSDIADIQPPDLSNSNHKFASFIKDNQLSFEERVLLILAIAPHLKPEFLEIYVNPIGGLQFYKAADFLNAVLGTRGQNYKGLLPTGLTYLYILAGTNIKERLRIQNLLSTMANPALQKAVIIQPHNLGEPAFSGRLLLTEEYLELFTIDQTDKEASIKYAFNNNK